MGEQPLPQGLKKNTEGGVPHPHWPGLRSRPHWRKRCLPELAGWPRRCWDASVGFLAGNCPQGGTGPWNLLQRVSRRSFTGWSFRRKCLTRGILLKLPEEVRGEAAGHCWLREPTEPGETHSGTLERPLLTRLNFTLAGKGGIFAEQAKKGWIWSREAINQLIDNWHRREYTNLLGLLRFMLPICIPSPNSLKLETKF